MITFAKPRTRYDSYIDFWRLVELSGFPICHEDEVKLGEDGIYVVCPNNGEWTYYVDQFKDETKARVYNWNLERPGNSSIDDYIYSNDELIRKGYYSGIIVSDRALAKRANFIHIPVGLHEGLGTPGEYDDKEYDAIHLMCPSYRRGDWFSSGWGPKSEVKGLKVATNCWGEERHEKLRRTRFMVNIHQDDHKIIEPLRFTLAAAYGLRIVSEVSDDFYPYDECNGVLIPDGDYRAPFMSYDEVAYRLGLYFRDKMLADFPFRLCVEKGLLHD